MKVVGLTGGIGMGKTAAAQCLCERGVPVIDTDDLARQVVEPGQPGFQEIRKAFGDGLLDAQGQLRRQELARIVFADPSARRRLEEITHPRIQELWLKQVAAWRADGRPVAVVVIPLLFETGADNALDFTVCVACTARTQQQRLRQRGWSDSEIQQRNAAQWPVERKIGRADFLVWTEGSLELLGEQLDRVLRRI